MNLLLYSPCPRRIFTVNTRVYESGVQVQCHLRASKPSSCAENGQMLGTVTYTEKRRFLLVTRLLLLRPCNPTRTSLETAITSFHSPVANPPVVSYFIQIKFFPILKALLRQASANLSGLLSSHFVALFHPQKAPFYLSSASTSCSPNSSVTLPSAWKDLPQGLPMLAHSYTLCFSSDGISSQSPP